MSMKILFWIFAILSLLAGMFMSVVSFFSHGLGLYFSTFGEIFCIIGMFSVIVSIVCAVLGIIRLRKGNVKKAVIFALIGLIFSGVVLAGLFIDEAVDTVLMEKNIAERNEQLYGENWDAAPAIEGIPKLYQDKLNKLYAVVRDEWPADQLMDLSAMSMAKHYGDAPLDNIGFIMMDVNGDGVNELLIGTVNPVEEGGTAIFCMYSNPENTFVSLSSVEEETYYLHLGKTAGTHIAEIDGMDAAWLLEADEGDSIVAATYQEGAMDPAGRLTLEMIPFSKYK